MSDLYIILTAIGVAVAGFLTLLFNAKSQGKKQAQAEQTIKTLEATRKAHKDTKHAKQKIKQMDDAAVRARASKFVRKPASKPKR